MSAKITPEVLWAQRSHETDPEKCYILLTLLIPDCKDPQLKLEPTFLEFSAGSNSHGSNNESQKYDLHVDFFNEIDPERSLHRVANGQGYFLKLYKKELGIEFWPRLTKEKLKYHYIKTDFDKWVDEDEQEGVSQQADFGGMEGLESLQGMGGMGGMGGGNPQAQLQELLKQSGGGIGGAGGLDEDDGEDDEDADEVMA